VPVTNAEFAAALGAALHRPAVMRMPAALLHRLGGDLAAELFLGGQRVLPDKAWTSGFVFRHATLESALESMLECKTPATNSFVITGPARSAETR
jgi:NAD dependent epimerase/dehydratase family enzyme